MRQGDTVIFVSGQSESNGHKEQPAIVTKMWNPTCANVKVLPDGGNHVYDATSCTVYMTEAEARAFLKAQEDAGNPNFCGVVWPVGA